MQACCLSSTLSGLHQPSLQLARHPCRNLLQANADALARRLREQLQDSRAAALASAAIGKSTTSAGSSGKRGQSATDKPATASAFSIPAVAFTQHAEPVETQSESSPSTRLHVRACR